jgi:hypothetical protein
LPWSGAGAFLLQFQPLPQRRLTGSYYMYKNMQIHII